MSTLRVLDRNALPARIEELRLPIERAQTVPEAIAFADDARSIVQNPRLIEAIAAMSGEQAIEVRRSYMEAALWASRRIGELLGPAKHGDASRMGSPGSRGELGDGTVPGGNGLPKVTRHKLRALAALPVSVFAAELERARTKGTDPSQAAMRRLAIQRGDVEAPARAPRPPRPARSAPVVSSDLEAVEAVAALLGGVDQLGEQVLAVAVQLRDVRGARGLEPSALKRGLREIADHLELAADLARELLEVEREAAQAGAHRRPR